MGARILIVEDNPANLELMTYLLNASGHHVLAAEDGSQGLDIASREQPDLIVCDVQLPDIDGFEVARWLKSHPQLRATPLVAVTALAMVGDRDRVLIAGFDGYLSKPIAPETFVQQIEAFLPDKQHTAARRSPDSLTSVGSHTTPQLQTILAVDNLAVNLDLARSIFEPSGYKVITASGAAEALALARTNSCDLILSDVCMSEESGYDLLRQVKNDSQLRSIPFILITSTRMKEKDRVQGLAMGAARFLCRPIEPELLLAEVRTCVAEGIE